MILLLVTCASIAIATLTSLAAWRMAVDADRRSAARVARLAAALETHPLPPSNRFRIAGAAIAAILAVSAVTVVAVALNAKKESTPDAFSAASSAHALELVGLTHERSGRELTIRGTVRNPSGGASIDGLTAVVLLYRTDGTLLTSTRAAVTPGRLTPGTDSTFTTTVAGDDVARYRVSFRSGDRVLPHVDRRTRS